MWPTRGACERSRLGSGVGIESLVLSRQHAEGICRKQDAHCCPLLPADRFTVVVDKALEDRSRRQAPGPTRE